MSEVDEPSVHVPEPPVPAAPTAPAAVSISARLSRAEIARQLRTKNINVEFVLYEACDDAGRAWREVRLIQLLAAQRGWSRRSAREACEQMAARLGLRFEESWTVGWLVDPRASGRRQLAFFDVLGRGVRVGERFPF